ncbi:MULTISPECIES: transposase [Bacteroides]|uniref:transposase n=1 Tax=Bacteroides TaxID=816 RepID=UPI001D06D7AF|nr:transposase [Bacteroides uniformis]
MEVMPDRVCLFIKATSSDSPAHIVSRQKGYTSFKVWEESIHLKNHIPALWSRFYSESAIIRYIESQKKCNIRE